MAHEELKALYEIDKQHSDKPWEFWQHRKLYQVWCDCLPSGPEWDDGSQYRRKPDAPVWPDDKEDARKWRELVQICDQVSEDGGLPERFYSEIAFRVKGLMNPQPQLIQGYTRDQWQTIIDGKFLCEFSGCGWDEDSAFAISTLTTVNGTSRVTFSSPIGSGYNHCRPLRTKGVRQPWFGGECPVAPDAEVLARSLDYGQAWHKRTARNVLWEQSLEFIEL